MKPMAAHIQTLRSLAGEQDRQAGSPADVPGKNTGGGISKSLECRAFLQAGSAEGERFVETPRRLGDDCQAAGTLGGRLLEGVGILRRVSRTPDRERRAQATLTNGHPKAFYGCENTHVPEDGLRAYRSATLRVVEGPHSPGRPTAVAFTISHSNGRDLDPEVHNFVGEL